MTSSSRLSLSSTVGRTSLYALWYCHRDLIARWVMCTVKTQHTRYPVLLPFKNDSYFEIGQCIFFNKETKKQSFPDSIGLNRVLRVFKISVRTKRQLPRASCWNSGSNLQTTAVPPCHSGRWSLKSVARTQQRPCSRGILLTCLTRMPLAVIRMLFPEPLVKFSGCASSAKAEA